MIRESTLKDEDDQQSRETSLRTFIDLSKDRQRVVELCDKGLAKRVVLMMDSDDEVIAILACTATSALTIHGDPHILNAFRNAGVVSKLKNLLSLSTRVVILQAIESIRDLARDSALAKDFINISIFEPLVQLLKDYEDETVISVTLDPLYILLKSNKELLVTYAKISAVKTCVEILKAQYSINIKTKILKFLYMFTRGGDKLRRVLVIAGVLKPLSPLLESGDDDAIAITFKMITGILSEDNEKAIIESGFLLPIVQVFKETTNEELKLVCATVLARFSSRRNLCIALRYMGWVEFVVSILPKIDDLKLMLQIAKFIFNTTRDEICRKFLLDEGTSLMLERVTLKLKHLNTENPLVVEILDVFKQTLQTLKLPISEDILFEINRQFSLEDNERKRTSAILDMPDFDAATIRQIDHGGTVRQSDAKRQRRVYQSPNLREKERDRRTTYLPSDGPLLMKRERIAKELLQTEETYMKSLLMCQTIMVEPARQLLSMDQVTEIFGGLEDILSISAAFYGSLLERIKKWSWNTKLSDLFLDLVEKLPRYSIFINKYTQSISAYETVLKENPRYKALVDQKCNEIMPSLNSGLCSGHFFIQPVQRIPRYILLLEDLQSSTPELHRDVDKLKMAVLKVKQVASDINELRKKAEDGAALTKLREKLTGYPWTIVKPGRTLIFEGTLMQVKVDGFFGRKTIYVYLFLLSDLCFITIQERKTYRYVQAIPANDIKEVVADSHEDNEKSQNFPFRLKFKSGAEDFQLKANTDISRTQWILALQKTIV